MVFNFYKVGFIADGAAKSVCTVIQKRNIALCGTIYTEGKDGGGSQLLEEKAAEAKVRCLRNGIFFDGMDAWMLAGSLIVFCWHRNLSFLFLFYLYGRMSGFMLAYFGALLYDNLENN